MRHMASADLDTRPVARAVGQLITSSDGAHRARFFCFHFRPFCRHLVFFCGYQIAPRFFFIAVVVVVFVVVAALVPLPFVFTAAIFSPFLLLVCIGLRILSLAPALFVLPSNIIISTSR
jgi:hypothetical protein